MEVTNASLEISIPSRSFSQLSPRERQVLTFLATFVDIEGYLPSARLLASECGLRSATSAARIVRVLEADGFIERDPDVPRVARIVVPAPLPSKRLEPGDELLLALVTVSEIDAAIALDRAALALAPDRDAAAHLHRSSIRRIELAKRYEAVVERLEATGAAMHPRARMVLDSARESSHARHRLIDTWDKYCMVTSMVDDALREFLTGPRELGRVHLQAIYDEELLSKAPTHPDLRRDWSALDPSSDLSRCRAQFVELMTRTVRVLVTVFPDALRPELERSTFA